MRGKSFGGIRAKFLFIFLVSLIFTTVIVLILNGIWRDKQTDYSYQIGKFTSECKGIYKEIDENLNNEEKIQDIINKDTNTDEVFIVDKQGNVILSHKNHYESIFTIYLRKCNNIVLVSKIEGAR